MKKQNKISKKFHLQQQLQQKQQQQQQLNCVQEKLQSKENSLGNLRVQTKTLSRLLIAQFMCETCDYNNNQYHNQNPNHEMASLPQGAFAACKLREQQQYHERDFIISRMKTSNADKNDLKTDNQKQMEYTPVKYNDKLMNSIWGLYNRYSPHNVKKNEYVPPKY